MGDAGALSSPLDPAGQIRVKRENMVSTMGVALPRPAGWTLRKHFSIAMTRDAFCRGTSSGRTARQRRYLVSTGCDWPASFVVAPAPFSGPDSRP